MVNTLGIYLKYPGYLPLGIYLKVFFTITQLGEKAMEDMVGVMSG